MEALDRTDFDSPTWRRLRALMADRIQAYLEDLLAPRDERETNLTRGRIRELKDLLALEPGPAGAPVPDDEGETD